MKSLPQLAPVSSIKENVKFNTVSKHSYRIPSATRITRNFNKDPSGKSRIVSIEDTAAVSGKEFDQSFPNFDIQSQIVPFANGSLGKRRVHADGLKMLENHYELIEEKMKV